MDEIPLLRKFKYQVAPRGNQTSSSSLNNGDPDQPSKYPAQEVITSKSVSLLLCIWLALCVYVALCVPLERRVNANIALYL